jgi:hypothetical protein
MLMRKGDIIIGNNEAWRITDPNSDPIKVIQIAGSSASVRTADVPNSFLAGKTVFRAVSDLTDFDATLAVAEVSKYVDIGELGHNPHLWVAAFLKRYESEQVPDKTTLLGWFANLIAAGEEKQKHNKTNTQRDRRKTNKVMHERITGVKFSSIKRRKGLKK